jgi:hypothetical protein
MVLLGDMGQVEARLVYLEIMLISTQEYCTVCAKCTIGSEIAFGHTRNHFGHNQWYSYVTWVKWKLVLVYLEIVLISVQDRCMVCAKCTTISLIILDTPNCTR